VADSNGVTEQLTFLGMPVAALKGHVQGFKDFDLISTDGEVLSDITEGDFLRLDSVILQAVKLERGAKFDQVGVGRQPRIGRITFVVRHSAITASMKHEEVEKQWQDRHSSSEPLGPERWKPYLRLLREEPA